MGETSRAEDIEEEKTPEKTVGNAVEAIKNKEAADPVISSGWMAKAKEFFNDEKSGRVDAEKLGGLAVDATRVGTSLALKIVWGLLKFAKKVIEKKGKISFKEGREIGEEMFSFDGKKDKK